jgi:virginiamycin B lyase
VLKLGTYSCRSLRWATMATCALACSAAAANASESSIVLPAGSVEEFPIAGGIYGSTELAVGAEGSIWLNQAAPGKIDRISPSGVITGEFSLLFGPGIQPYWPEYSEPSALAPGLDGDMWFTERGTNEEGRSFIGSVTPAGEISEFAIQSTGSMPAGIALGADGGMWFTEEGTGKIGRVTEDGIMKEFLIPSTDRDEYLRPVAIALGSDGNVWFTDRGLSDQGQNLIGQVTPEGAVREFSIPAPYDDPDALALGADGSIWFTESPDAIGSITPAGSFTEYTVPSVSDSTSGIAEGPDGNMWFTENANAIGRITPQGEVTSFEGASAGDGLPGSIVQGGEGDLWYADGGDVDRLRTPLAPVNATAPVVSGQAVEGMTLSVSQGAWSNAPSAFDYQWQICDGSGASCTDLSGANASTSTLVASEVGHTLRAVITASSAGGLAAAASSVSAVVQAAPRALLPPASPKASVASEPLPVVSSAMTWSFGWTQKYTIVESLVVRGVPAGGVVQVTCRGHGCPFERWSSTTVVRHTCKHGRCRLAAPTLAHGRASMARLFTERHLQVGARVVVDVLKAGWIGKSFVFTMRADKAPRVQITCLGSGPSNPAGGC